MQGTRNIEVKKSPYTSKLGGDIDITFSTGSDNIKQAFRDGRIKTTYIHINLVKVQD